MLDPVQPLEYETGLLSKVVALWGDIDWIFSQYAGKVVRTVTCATTIDFHYFYVISSYKTAEKTIIQTEKVDYLGNLSRVFGPDLFLLLEMIFWLWILQMSAL